VNGMSLLPLNIYRQVARSLILELDVPQAGYALVHEFSVHRSCLSQLFALPPILANCNQANGSSPAWSFKVVKKIRLCNVKADFARCLLVVDPQHDQVLCISRRFLVSIYD